MCFQSGQILTTESLKKKKMSLYAAGAHLCLWRAGLKETPAVCVASRYASLTM